MRFLIIPILLMLPVLWGAEDAEMEALLSRAIGPIVYEKNVDFKLIEAEMQRIRDRFSRDDLITARLYPPRELHSFELHILFPDAKFYLLRYDMQATEFGRGRVSCALGFEDTLMVFDDNHSEVFHHGGNQEGFAKLLVKYHIELQTEFDARLISTAAEELMGRHHAKGEWANQKISDTEWHLAIDTNRDSTYYYQVITTKNGLCLSGKLCSVQADRPSEKKK